MLRKNMVSHKMSHEIIYQYIWLDKKEWWRFMDTFKAIFQATQEALQGI